MSIERRNFLGSLGVAGLLGLATPREQKAQEQVARATRAMPIPKIKDVSVIECQPAGVRLTVVKITTDQDGLYGYGCATFTQRADLVKPAVERYLKPFLIGKTTDRIEDIWQSCYDSSYWKNGPVLNNAISGVDQALWDIKGRQAGMPVYQLAGGKCREAADCYGHADGADFPNVVESAKRYMAQGFRHVRVQIGVPGMAGYGSSRGGATVKALHNKPVFEPAAYTRRALKLFEVCRKELGDEVELLHDVHERITLNQAVNLCKALEPYRLFFVEDPLPPEENDHFRILRQQSSVPLAMGELFNTVHEYAPLLSERLIDFIRIHISQIGGLSPARKVQALAEFFGVRTAWHGPGDASPIAHAAQLALELASYNFGVHEGGRFQQATRDVFPGCPETKDGYLMAVEAPGLGIDIDEKAAAKFPFPPGPPNFDYAWGTTRRRDGTVIRP